MKKVLLILSVVAASTLLSTILAFVVYECVIFIPKEFGVQWHGAATQFDSELGWATVPSHKADAYGDKVIAINSFGFRSPEVNPSAKHIVLLGDSVIWGYGVNGDETLSAYLQQLVSSKWGDRFQVVNLGVPGYGFDQYYLWFRRHINSLNPALVILVSYSGNDLAETSLDNFHDKSKPLFSLEEGKLYNLRPRISRYSCINLFAKSYILTRYPLFQRWRSAICGEQRVHMHIVWGVVSALVDEIRRMTEAKGARLLSVVSPTQNDLRVFETEPGAAADLSKFFASKNIPVISLFPFLKKADVTLDKLYFDDAHFKPVGNDLVAKTLWAKIEEWEVLDNLKTVGIARDS